MHRPSKKKKDHPGAPGASADQHTVPANARGDDRNLVSVDSAFEGAEFEDKVWLFWHRNKYPIIFGSVAALLGIIVIQGYRMIQERNLLSLQDAYVMADQENNLETFGQQYASTPLGGLALLESADNQYTEGNFAEAADLYRQAIAPLKDSPLSQRAQLGLGMAQLKAGQTTEAVNTLKALVHDSKAIGTVRGEAAYNIALHAVTEKDFSTAQEWIDHLKAIPNADFWIERARLLTEAVPELKS